MGNDTQEKKIKDILSVSRVKLQKTTNGTFPAAGSQLANNAATERGTYRMTDINSNATSLRIRLDSQSSTDSCSAIGVLFRTKRSPR